MRGHSDADVVAHAVTDAVLGAAGIGDVGEHFPDTDPQWAGADSIAMLTRSVSYAHDVGFVVVNVDCVVVLENPILRPHLPAMQQRLSAAAGGPVSVKAKRAEGLGAIGRNEGVACFATALLESI